MQHCLKSIPDLLVMNCLMFAQISDLTHDFSTQLNHMSENESSDMYAQRRFRLACAFAQSDQNLHLAHFGLPRMQSVFMLTDRKDA